MNLQNIMKLLILFILMFYQAITCFGQREFCADSSFRIKYIFGNTGAELYNNPDTLGRNYFTGRYFDGVDNGMALMKTDWGDSVMWAKKVSMNIGSFNSYLAPNGKIISTGAFGLLPTSYELMICKLDTNFNMEWAKRFKLIQNHIKYFPGNFFSKNLLIANNAIYVNAEFYSNISIQHVIAKLDMDGNILWSKNFIVNSPKHAELSDAVSYNNNLVYFTTRVTDQPPGLGEKEYSVITKLNDSDGSIVEANSFKTVPDPIVKGINTVLTKFNSDTTYSLLGFIDINTGGGYFNPSGIPFSATLDNNFNSSHSYYYKNTLLSNQDSYFDFNNKKQHIELSDNGGNAAEKYFVTFNNADQISRCRIFTLPPLFSAKTSVNLDDNQNVHFLYHYQQNNKIVTEYARISNFAPSGALGCFGKDTSIFKTYPFTLVKAPFTWDNILSDVIIGNPINYVVGNVSVTKQVVCKLVSRCDSVHINGPSTTCINTPIRFTVTKNSTCLKNLEWVIDTTVATIVSTEGDSAITLSFIHPFSGYIHAVISNCVVGDSLYVSTIPAPIVHLINPDTLLCPGRAIALKATSGFRSYLWQDGRVGTIYNTDSAGFYKVSATDACGFKTSDSVTIKKSDNSLVVPTSQTVCLNDTAFIPLPNDLNSITWSPTTSSLLSNNTLKLFPRTSTTYTINAFRMANCIITRNTSVKVNLCPETVFIPNSFSPNNDGLNDIFMAAVSRPLAYFSLSIYNRFGQEIFHTANPNVGWNGSYNGKPQPIGVYPYQCFYRFPVKMERTVIGTITLVR